LNGTPGSSPYDLVTWLALGSTPLTTANVDLSLNGGDMGLSSSDLSIVASGSNDILEFDAAVVPEPSTWALMLGGLAVLIFIQRRRRVNN
jgi:hypothetical protein